jgi:hypothetical protein
MSIEHKNSVDPNIHVPRGFSTASPLQFIRKNAGGTDIEWVDHSPAYGCMYATSTTTTGVDGTWRPINVATLGGAIAWTTQTNSNITPNTTSGFYEADISATYMIGAAISLSGAIVAVNEFQFTIGMEVAPSYPSIVEKSSVVTVYRTITSADKGSVAMMCQPTLAQGDRIYLMVRRNSGSDQVVFNHINFIITKVS